MLRFEGKQNSLFQTLSVLLYSDEIKIKKIFIQQLYFVVKTIPPPPLPNHALRQPLSLDYSYPYLVLFPNVF